MNDVEDIRSVSLLKRAEPEPGQRSNGEIILAWIVTGLTGLYMLPWAVAASRRSTRSIQIAIATSLLAWTGIGWLVLLVLAFFSPTADDVIPSTSPA